MDLKNCEFSFNLALQLLFIQKSVDPASCLYLCVFACFLFSMVVSMLFTICIISCCYGCIYIFSFLTIVTPHNMKYRFKSTITSMGQTIHVNDKNILGVTIDCGWTFRQHTQDINVKAKSQLNVMQALSANCLGT